MPIGQRCCGVHQRTTAVRLQSEDVAGAGAAGQRFQGVACSGRADQHFGLGVVDEMAHLRLLVGGIERHEDMPRPQGGEVQHRRLHRLVHLRRHPGAGRQLQRKQQVGNACGGGVQIAPGIQRARLGFDRARFEVGWERCAQGGEQVGARLRGGRQRGRGNRGHSTARWRLRGVSGAAGVGRDFHDRETAKSSGKKRGDRRTARPAPAPASAAAPASASASAPARRCRLGQPR